MSVGWKTVRLEDIAEVERGKFSVRPRNDPRYYGGDIPFLQTGDVTGAPGIISSYSQTLNKEGDLESDNLFYALLSIERTWVEVSQGGNF